MKLQLLVIAMCLMNMPCLHQWQASCLYSIFTTSMSDSQSNSKQHQKYQDQQQPVERVSCEENSTFTNLVTSSQLSFKIPPYAHLYEQKAHTRCLKTVIILVGVTCSAILVSGYTLDCGHTAPAVVHAIVYSYIRSITNVINDLCNFPTCLQLYNYHGID